MSTSLNVNDAFLLLMWLEAKNRTPILLSTLIGKKPRKNGKKLRIVVRENIYLGGKK